MGFRTSLAALFLAPWLLMACGDSPTQGTTTTTAPATTTIPASADIDVEITGLGGFISGMGNVFQVRITITESGGVGARINFARLEVFRATGELEERQEIGSGLIIAGLGDNKLEADSSEDIVLTFPFNATAKSGRELLLTMGFTDESGNDHESTDTFIVR